MKRALIACGGTGGHLAPGIALAEELVSRGWSCELLISKKQVDAQLVKKYRQFEYDSIPGCAMSFSPVRFSKFLRDLFSGVRICIRKIRKTQPDAVIGFGGFSSASALLAGIFTKIPVAIHEANRVPGRVTRLLSRFANRVYLPTDVYLKSVRSGRTFNVGMPIRTEIEKMAKDEAKRLLGFDPNRKLLLVFGGSQGARSLNEWMAASMEPLALDSVQMLCLTGNREDEAEERMYPAKAGEPVRSLILGFSDQMALLLSAADLAVSRSGAGSIAEIARCRTPSVFIPYPYAADDHQFYNAKRVTDAGGGLLLNHESMDELFELVRITISDDDGLREFESCLEAIDGIDAKSIIADDIEMSLVSSKSASRTEVGAR
ncbi:MAG: UDP-N-acetylglucosamine--N-acetylmuramyl-(pentapeptide) pyrophosphoryl-undecaprenol N-acetylglucosamine transferase [Opitutaceae bacterium]|nr:UDP-N-acetylglucosamine--N-acetylmuramyl-(pentapeptide) pyrophosphoryl-undecaprenol N-acetylglucosamine transferase [Opitutaceae bacterium]